MFGILTQYKIIVCPHCGLIQFVKEGQRTRKCPDSKCKKIINLEHVIVYARTNNINDAVAIVQKLKGRKINFEELNDIRPILEEEDTV